MAAKELTRPARKRAAKEAPTPAPVEPSRAIEIVADPDKTPEQQVACLLIEGVVPNADLAMAWQSSMFPGVSLNAASKALREHVDRVKGGDLQDMEALLVSQAYTLNAVFVSMTRQASNNRLDGKALDLTLRLAFKAQAQTRATVEAVGELKNPRQVTFAKQANISNGPQQVNNGTSAQPAEAAPTRTEEARSAPNKQLEVQDAEWVDAGAARASEPGNPEVAAVATVHRPDFAGRKVRMCTERVERRGAATLA